MLQFDAEASRRVEAIYMTPDVVEQRQAVLGALGLRRGERVIDIGTGPGLLAAEIAAAVGPDGLVCGIDISDSMLALARARATRPSSAPMEFRQAGADRLPYAQASFDVAVATQVLEYVKDVPGALAEIWRGAAPRRPGAGTGHRLGLDRLALQRRGAHGPGAGRLGAAPGRPPSAPHPAGALERAGLQVAPPQVVPLCNVGFDPATYSAGLLEGMVGFVVGRDGLTAEEAQAWATDLRSLGADYFCLNRYLFCATKTA
jgi:ubiquinone/menaquinone biosynthesis C-methylase UbiE